MLIPVILAGRRRTWLMPHEWPLGIACLMSAVGRRFAWTAADQVAATHQDTNLDRNAGANGRSRDVAPQTSSRASCRNASADQGKAQHYS
jgi:hypothetical protein